MKTIHIIISALNWHYNWHQTRMYYSFYVDKYILPEKSKKYIISSFDELCICSLSSRGESFRCSVNEKQNNQKNETSSYTYDYDYDKYAFQDKYLDVNQDGYAFSSCDGSKTIILSEEQLDQYPNCLFNTIILFDLTGDKQPNGSYKTRLTSKTLEFVKFFFYNGYWQENIHIIATEKMEVYGEEYSNKQVCEYLGLPDIINGRLLELLMIGQIWISKILKR